MITKGRKNGSNGNKCLSMNQKCGVQTPHQVVKEVGIPLGNPVNRRGEVGCQGWGEEERAGGIRVCLSNNHSIMGGICATFECGSRETQ